MKIKKTMKKDYINIELVQLDKYVQNRLNKLKMCKNKSDIIGFINRVYSDGFEDGNNNK